MADNAFYNALQQNAQAEAVNYTASNSVATSRPANPFLDVNSPTSYQNQKKTNEQKSNGTWKSNQNKSNKKEKSYLQQAQERLDTAQQNLGYVTDPISEAAARKEYNEAKVALDQAKAESNQQKTSAEVEAAGGRYTPNYGTAGGNIDLNARPTVANPNFTYSTVDSVSIGVDDKTVLIPTVINENGKWKHVSVDEAIDHYFKTGEQLGIFDTPEEAGKYGIALHNDQANQYDASAPQFLGQKENLPDISNLSQLSIQQGPQKVGEQELVPGRADQLGYRATNTITGAGKQIGSNITSFVGTLAKNAGETMSNGTTNNLIWRQNGEGNPNSLNAKMAPSVDKFGSTVQATADELGKAAQADIDQAKNGLSKFGQAGVDIATNVIQMGFDAAVGAVTGGASLASMFVRSAGGAMQKARNEGADTTQQTAYGLATGAIEVITEKLADGVAKIYGGGAADDIAEKLVRKFAKTDTGRTALRALYGMVSEGGEEVISDLLAPYADLLYNDKSFSDTLKNTFKGTYDPSELLYDFVIGFTIGGLGQGASIATGQNAQANAELRAVDTIQNNLVANGMDASNAGRAANILSEVAKGETISQRDSKFLDSVGGYNTSTPQASNPLVQNSTTSQPTATGRNGRTYEGVGQKAQNPERAAQNPANATDAGGYKEGDSEYRGYQITVEKGNYLNGLRTIYRITSPDGRWVGNVPISSKASAQITEQVNDDISLHAEAQQAETPAPATPQVDASAPVPSEPETPARTVETVQAELDPILNEISEIDKAIAENDAAMKQMMSEADSPDDKAIIRGQANQVRQSLEADKAKLQEQADDLKKEQRDIRSTEIQAEKGRLSAGREATGARKAPNPQPETHIDNRTTESVGKSNVNAFQYDNPEVKPFYKRAAEILMRDLGFMQSSKRSEYGKGTVYGASSKFLERVSSYFGSLNDAIAACEQIIYDKGRENFADPKRIELFLDEMLSNGYEPVDTSLPIIQASSDYLALKGSLQGGTQYDPRARAIQAEMASDFTGSMTEEEAGTIVDRNYAETGFYDPYTRDGQADPSVNEGRQTFEDIDAADTASMEEKYGRGNAAETQNTASEPTTQADTHTEQQSAGTSDSEQFNSNPEESSDNSPSGETWNGDEVPTQSTFHDQLTEEEKARDELNPENDTHVQHHDTEVDNYAQNRITERGHDGAREDLMSRDPAEWDDVDVRTAQILLSEELEQARQLTGEEQDAAYKRIAELKNAYNKQGTEAGRTLRQRQRFGGTKAEIVSEAANILYGDENTGKLRKLSPEQKSQIMQQVDEFSTRMENAQDGDAKSLKDIIMEVAKIRNTHGILDFGQGKLGKVIDAVAKSEGGMDFLRQLATTQIRSIASDQIKTSFADKAKALRYMNMLSNPATASRNVGANTVFGNFIDAISSNLSSPVDAFMGLFTGRRTVANERLSKASLKGSIDAGLKSWLEVTLDAEAEQSTYAYNEIKGRTFKANGNFVERLMSAFERNQGYQLKTTDQIAKGGIEAEQRRALGKLGERTGKVDADSIDTLAQEEAKYRTLQNESGLSKAAQSIRNALNSVLGIRDKNGKTVYGLGEDILPFAQVPANVVQTELNMNPLAIFPAIGRVFGVMANGKNATPQQQRAAAKAFGQAVNGTAMVAAAALMSAKGVLRYTDDDDKDQKQLHKAEGKSGLQINFSAAARLFTGGDPSEQDGDKWGNIGWIPQLNSLLIIGNMVYEDYKDMPEHKELADWAKLGGNVALDSLQGMYESILEFPAVSTISSMINAAKYANVPDDATDAQRLGIQAGSILADKVANTATGFLLPNVVRATAAGLDDTERNLYSADNRLDQALDSIKAGIPDNPLIPQQYTRGSLPAQTDNFGNPIKNEGGSQQFLNKVILPGAITTDRENAVLDEIDRVAMASGNADAIPDKNGAYTVTNGKDKYKLTGEERIAYQQYAGKRSEEYIRGFINSSLYSQMNDDQRAETMAKLNQQAKSEANKHYLEQKGIKSVDKLTEGKDAPGTSYDYTPLNKSNVATYYAYETMMKQAVEDGDYSTIDNLARRYNSLNGNLQTVLSERDDSLRAVLKWSSAGIGSQTYYSFVEASKASQARLDKSSRTGSTVELDALANMNISEAEKRRIIDNVEGVGSKTVKGVYDILYNYGFNSKQINEFWNTSQNWVYKDTGDTQSSQKAGTLQPLEAYYAIEQLPGLDDAQKQDIYNQMKEVANVPYKINDWGNYTFGSERSYYQSGRSRQQFGGSGISNGGNYLFNALQDTQQNQQSQGQAVNAFWNYLRK